MAAVVLIVVLSLLATYMMSPTSRHTTGPTVRAVVLIVAVIVVTVVWMGLRELRQWNEVMARIATSEVELAGLKLSVSL
jgi:hypothetical protein